MTTLRFVGALSLLFLCSACSPVRSQHVVGEQVTEDLSDEFEGVWRLADEFLFIHQVEPGELRVAGLDWNDEEQSFEVNEFTIILSSLDGDSYLNVVDSEESERDETWYMFSRYRMEHNVLVCWAPEPQRFADAVGNRELIGRIPPVENEMLGDKMREEIWITGDHASFNAFMQNHPASELFMLEEPAVVIRIAEY